MGVTQRFNHRANVTREQTEGEDEWGNPAWRNTLYVWDQAECHIFQAKGRLAEGEPGSPAAKQTPKNVWRIMHGLECPVQPLDAVTWVETGRKFRVISSVTYKTHIETDLEDIGV